jgi:hypothetical protein
MKKYLVSVMTALLSSIVFTPLNAQLATNYKPNNLNRPEGSFSLAGGESVIAPSQVDKRTREDFVKRFPATNEPTWVQISNGFVATFKDATCMTRVVYKKHGRWQYSIKNYFDEKLLPTFVRAQVKSTYYDFKIDFIQEIRVPGNEDIIYLFILVNDQYQQMLRLCNGEMNVIHEGTRST